VFLRLLSDERDDVDDDRVGQEQQANYLKNNLSAAHGCSAYEIGVRLEFGYINLFGLNI